MSEGIIVALIGGAAAVLVGVIGLVKQWLGERRADRAARLEATQGTHEALFEDLRHVLHEERTAHDRTRADLEREREDHAETRVDRDAWRTKALRDGRLLEQMQSLKERKSDG